MRLGGIAEGFYQSSRHQGVFKTEVVFPATTEEYNILSITLQAGCQCVYVGESPHQRQVGIGGPENGYSTIGGAVGNTLASKIIA